MTPAVQKLHADNLKGARIYLLFNVSLACIMYVSSGIWLFIFINLFISWLEFESVRMKHMRLLIAEQEMIMQIRVNGWDKTRIDLLKFEEEAERNPSRFERFRQMRFATELRSIMEDVNKEIKKHELKEN